MNIYEYMHSPDIAAHCEKIGHIFSPLDMAVLIKLSDKTMKEKHAAWKEIISDYPDMPINESSNFKARDSLHEFLRELIRWEEKIIEKFYRSDRAVYRYAVVHYPLRGWHISGKYLYFDELDTYEEKTGFSTAEKAWKDCLKNWLNKDHDEKVEEVELIKGKIDKEYKLSLKMNKEGEVIDIHTIGWEDTKSCPGELDMIYIHIPVPFAKGDLLDSHGKPVVLTWIPHMMKEEEYAKRISGKSGDGSDMIAYMFFINEDGYLRNDHGRFTYYYELSYYRGELKGQDRFLKYISYYVKREDSSNNLDWIINVFCKFKAEADGERTGQTCMGTYISLDDERYDLDDPEPLGGYNG